MCNYIYIYIYINIYLCIFRGKTNQLLKTTVFQGRLLHDMTSALYIDGLLQFHFQMEVSLHNG